MQKEVYEFISKQTSDPIVERRTCRRTGENFPIYQGDKDLLEKISPKIGGQKYSLPKPTLSPKAREIRRLMWRNDINLYKTKCKISGKNIITYYHPQLEDNIVDHKLRFENIDNSKYGVDFDMGESFFEQYANLMQKTAKQNVLNVGIMENSDYCHNAGGMKNCYMVFDCGLCENVLYSVRIAEAKNCIDCYEVWNSEICYDSCYLKIVSEING